MNKQLSYISMFLFLGPAGMPYLMNSNLYKIFVFGFLIFLFFKNKNMLDKKFVYFIGILTILTLLQTWKFNFISIQTILGLYITVTSAYLIVKILKKDFIYYYINSIYIIAIISLIFYVLLILFPFLHPLLLNISSLFKMIHPSSLYDTIIIFNVTTIDTMRNPGPFWEPGAFAGYLIVALVFNFFTKDKLFNKEGKIIFIALLTTMSTTSFLALGVFLFVVYYKKVNNFLFKYIIIAILISTSIYTYNTLSFLGEKIEKQYLYAINTNLNSTKETQRFVNILKDIEDFKGHEFIGRGINSTTRYDKVNKREIRTVGFTDSIVKFGLPFFIFMIYLIYKSIKFIAAYYEKSLSNIFIVLITFVLLIPLASEIYFSFTLYWTLLFLSFVYVKKIKESNNYENV